MFYVDLIIYFLLGLGTLLLVLHFSIITLKIVFRHNKRINKKTE